MHTHDRGMHVSRSTVALGAVTALGVALILLLPDPRTERGVEIGTFGLLVWIVKRSHQRCESLIDAALRLADELAKPPARDAAASDTGVGLARVVQLPVQERPHAS